MMIIGNYNIVKHRANFMFVYREERAFLLMVEY